MEFVDGDGNIIVPKSVRPIIDLSETAIGSKKGAKKQYRYGNLHIREYDDHYAVHMDRVDPLQDPLGHLLVDAPEYLAGAAAAILVGRKVGATVYNKRKQEGRSSKDAAIDAVIAGYVAGSSAGRLAFDTANSIKKRGK
ncbi:MAG TPA: hypothetical protein VHL10_09695 [Nitrososphaera sp.]|nr:hypothetical protein [Nitrososphaera sp.]